jgi:hypothetical protein
MFSVGLIIYIAPGDTHPDAFALGQCEGIKLFGNSILSTGDPSEHVLDLLYQSVKPVVDVN